MTARYPARPNPAPALTPRTAQDALTELRAEWAAIRARRRSKARTEQLATVETLAYAVKLVDGVLGRPPTNPGLEDIVSAPLVRDAGSAGGSSSARQPPAGAPAPRAP